MCFEYVWYVFNGIRTIVWFGVIILRSRKGAAWKSWLDPRFPQNSKSKWTLKWLPLDRGYFKFYFHKGESILIISCHTSLLTRKFIILFQVIIALSCILFSFKMSCNSVLLINNPSKKRWRGNFGAILGFPIIPSKNEV